MKTERYFHNNVDIDLENLTSDKLTDDEDSFSLVKII